MLEIRRANDLDEMSGELSGHDTLVVNDPSVSEFLDGRLGEDTEVGTPEELLPGSGFRQELFLEISSSMTWRQASYVLRKSLSCCKYTGGLESLEKAGLSGEIAEKARRAFRSVENPYVRAQDTVLDGDVAVLNPWALEKVWKQILPEDHVRYCSLGEESTSLDDFYSLRTGGDIARCIAEKAEEVGPEHIAVLAPESSRYRSLVMSELEKRGVSYISRKASSESEDVRTFIQLARVSLKSGRIRKRDVRPVARHLGVDLGTDGKYLEESGSELKELLNVLKHLTFGEAVQEIREAGIDTVEVSGAIESLGIEDEKIESGELGRLEYYLKNLDSARDEEAGVLIADPPSTTAVDRKHVFFPGLDTEWNRELEDDPWVDKSLARNRILKEFQLMLQAGRHQYYLFDESNGEKPCFHLTEAAGREITEFSEFDALEVSPSGTNASDGFRKMETDVPLKQVETLSQSELNSLALSPRLYYFENLVSDPGELNMVIGSLFHDFAELYVNVDDVDEDEAIELMMEEAEPYMEEYGAEEIRKKFEVGVENIMEYIDSRDIQDTEIDAYTPKSRNVFEQKLDYGIKTRLTELRFEDPEQGSRGKIDFLKDPKHLVDYKSGRFRSKKKTVSKARVDLYEEERFPDFQPLMYLAQHRKHAPGQRLSFTFFYFLDGIGEHVKGEGDIEDSLVTVEYIPQKFGEHLASDEVFQKLTEGVSKSNDRRKTLEKLGKETFIRFVEEERVPGCQDKDGVLETDFVERLNALASQEVGDYSYVEKGVRSAARKLVEIRNRSFFKEDLDEFESFLQEKLEEANEYRRNGFPLGDSADRIRQQDLVVREE
ncbi:MAG: PD-(D/E)XK nuclease family protein [Candidatus Nanohaloarchaea archaeon]